MVKDKNVDFASVASFSASLRYNDSLFVQSAFEATRIGQNTKGVGFYPRLMIHKMTGEGICGL